MARRDHSYIWLVAQCGNDAVDLDARDPKYHFHAFIDEGFD